MWITSLCSLLSVGYRGQHDLNTQVANTQHFGWVFATWVFTTLSIVEVGYSVLLPISSSIFPRHRSDIECSVTSSKIVEAVKEGGRDVISHTALHKCRIFFIT